MSSSVLDIVADALEAVADGRGMNAKHIAAIRLAEAGPAMLAVLRLVEDEYCIPEMTRDKIKAVIAGAARAPTDQKG